MRLQTGDIFATKGRGIAGWAVRNLINPPTDRFHFGIVWLPLPDGDWIILESIMKGVAVGLLSWYDASELEFYKVDCRPKIRLNAPLEVITYGRAWYDYFLIVKFFFGFIAAYMKLLAKLEFRKLRPEDLPYVRNSMLICTEAAEIGYSEVGLIPEGVAPIPNSFRQAEIAGKLKRI